MSGSLDFTADLILVCNSLDAGGIERVVSTLANEWSRRGRKVCVVTMHDRQRFYTLRPEVHHVVVHRSGILGFAEFLKAFKERLRGLPRPGLVGSLGGSFGHYFAEKVARFNFRLFFEYESWALARVLRRVASPVVLAFGTGVNVVALKACAGTGRRVIISERSDPTHLSHTLKWERLSRRFYPRADLVTANTRSAVNSLRDYVAPGKTAFVPNPLAPANGNGHERRDGEAGPPRAPFILTVGRLVHDKAPEVLLEAFALAGGEIEGWRLAFVGGGHLGGRLRARAERLAVADRVDWHGLVRDPHAFYRAAGLFVLSSRVEGMPNALLEAMSWGLPVVVTDGAPGPLELVEDGVTGLVVPVNDPPALAAAIRRLAGDEALRRRLGAAARARVSEYELPRALAAWESVIGLTA